MDGQSKGWRNKVGVGYGNGWMSRIRDRGIRWGERYGKGSG